MTNTAWILAYSSLDSLAAVEGTYDQRKLWSDCVLFLVLSCADSFITLAQLNWHIELFADGTKLCSPSTGFVCERVSLTILKLIKAFNSASWYLGTCYCLNIYNVYCNVFCFVKKWSIRSNPHNFSLILLTPNHLFVWTYVLTQLNQVYRFSLFDLRFAFEGPSFQNLLTVYWLWLLWNNGSQNVMKRTSTKQKLIPLMPKHRY